MDAPTTTYQDRCVRLTNRGHVIVAVWRDPPNRPRVAALRALQQRTLAAHGGLAALHAVVAGSTSPLTLPDADRSEMADVIRALRGTSSAMAISFEGPAFFVASWRSILSAVVLLLRPDFPLRVFGDRRAAAEWLAAQRVGAGRGLGTTADELLGRVRDSEAGLLPP